MNKKDLDQWLLGLKTRMDENHLRLNKAMRGMYRANGYIDGTGVHWRKHSRLSRTRYLTPDDYALRNNGADKDDDE